MTATKVAVAQVWWESERGWGQSPSDLSLHLSMDDCRRFKEEYIRKHHTADSPPDCYEFPNGDPFGVLVLPDTYERLVENNPPAGEPRGLMGATLSSKRSAQGMPIASLPLPTDVRMEVIVEQARAQAEADFANILRKVPKGSSIKPAAGFSHLDRVAELLAEAKYDRHLVAAGYLHDHIEDLSSTWNKARIERYFGSKVATLVDWVTEQNQSLSWEKRKEAYVKRLRKAPVEALALSCADKTANLEDALEHMRRGFPPQSFLKRGWQAQSKRLRALQRVFDGNVEPKLFARFSKLLAAFEEKAKQLMRA